MRGGSEGGERGEEEREREREREHKETIPFHIRCTHSVQCSHAQQTDAIVHAGKEDTQNVHSFNEKNAEATDATVNHSIPNFRQH